MSKEKKWKQFYLDGNMASGRCLHKDDLDRIKAEYEMNDQETDIMDTKMEQGSDEECPCFSFRNSEGMTLREFINDTTHAK